MEGLTTKTYHSDAAGCSRQAARFKRHGLSLNARRPHLSHIPPRLFGQENRYRPALPHLVAVKSAAPLVSTAPFKCLVRPARPARRTRPLALFSAHHRHTAAALQFSHGRIHSCLGPCQVRRTLLGKLQKSVVGPRCTRQLVIVIVNSSPCFKQRRR